MTAKEYLSQSLRLNQRINSKLEQIQSLRELATKCTSIITGMPRNPNHGGSTMADALMKIVDLETELQNDVNRLVDLKEEIMAVVKAVDNIECQTLLELRYLCFNSWAEIADKMDFGPRWVHILHGRALAEVDKNLSKKRQECT